MREHYGKVIVEFKDELRPRTTFNVGDSIDQNARPDYSQGRMVEDPHTLVSPVNDPDAGALLFGGFRDPLDAVDIDDLAATSGVFYVEAQYWGPVTTDDIAAVYLDPSEIDLADELEQAGIEVHFFG